MTFTRKINGIDVEARYPDSDVERVYIPALRKFTELYRQKGKRIIIFLAAPPGAGKTTLSLLLQELSRSVPDVEAVTAVGMDGFHFPGTYLNSHFTVRNGERIPLKKIKGAPETFDLGKLADAIRKLALGEKCRWPEYSRILHDPVEDAVTVDGNIVLIEGNYLLLDEPGWRNLKAFADYTIRIEADEAVLRERLISRKEAGGLTHEEAAAYVEYSDLRNVRLCLTRSMEADMIIKI